MAVGVATGTTFEGVGIAPDISVKQGTMSQQDWAAATLTRAIEHIGSNAGQGATCSEGNTVDAAAPAAVLASAVATAIVVSWLGL